MAQAVSRRTVTTGLIPGQFVWYLWGTKLALRNVFLQVLRFPPVIIMPIVLLIGLHLNTAFIRRTNGRILGTPKNAVPFGMSGSIGKKMYYDSVLFLGTFAKLWKATVNCITSVCPSAWKSSVPNERIFGKFDIWIFFENVWRKFKFRYSMTRIRGTLYEYVCTFMIVSRWILRRMRNVSDKNCRENQNTLIVFKNFLPKIVLFVR
jgi:hypothetical protein